MTIKHAVLNFLTVGLLSVAAAPGFAEVVEGKASYYADSLNGNTTASGEPYDKNAMTAAHHSLPFGTTVKVTYLKTGETVEVTVNDRGPHAKGILIDVSGAAAEKLGMKEDGVGAVKIEYSE